MNLFRLLALFLLTTASFQINAAPLSGFLDVSSYGGTAGSGRYFVGVGLFLMDSGTLEISQSLVPRPGDEPGLRCVTEISLHAGKFQVLLTDADRDEKAELNNYLNLYASYWHPTENCTPVAEILSEKINFGSVFYAGTVSVSYAPPQGFNESALSLSLMPYGAKIALKATIAADGSAVVENLKEQLNGQPKREMPVLFYTLYAKAPGKFAELISDFIELK